MPVLAKQPTNSKPTTTTVTTGRRCNVSSDFRDLGYGVLSITMPGRYGDVVTDYTIERLDIGDDAVWCGRLTKHSGHPAAECSTYTVILERGGSSCNCDDQTYRGAKNPKHKCKHQLSLIALAQSNRL